MTAAASPPLASVPAPALFVASALFHYLGPSFAVILFASIGPLGVAWLRIAAAAAVFALWRRPWRLLLEGPVQTRLLVLALGVVLAAMNASFYIAIARLPLASVAAIEFVPVVLLALVGVRSARNALALIAAASGAYLVIGFQPAADAVGIACALVNAALFALYIVIGHALARTAPTGAVDRLGAAMLVAFVIAAPFGFAEAEAAFTRPLLLAAAIGVGITSSVIPYVLDQLAMARLPRASFALFLALLPATAALAGALVLRQVPGPLELAGIALVAFGIALHRSPEQQPA